MAQQIVDLGNGAFFSPSIVNASPSSGTTIGYPLDMKDCDSFCNVWVVATATSGPITIQVQTTDLSSGDLYGYSGTGGPLSGAFSDPTSGLTSPLAYVGSPTLPTSFQSGGLVIFNSGVFPLPGAGTPMSGVGYYGGFPAGTFPWGITPTIQSMGGPAFINTSGGVLYPRFASGGMGVAGLQRPNRYLRINLLSGPATAGTFVTAGVISQLDTTGVGGGFSWLPGSGLSGGVGGTGFVGAGAYAGMPNV